MPIAISKDNVKILSSHKQQFFIADWYDLASDSHFWMAGRLAAAIKQFRRNNVPLDKNLRGLEIGCGHGVLRAQIEKHSNWTVDGCDLDLDALQSKALLRGETYLYDIFDRANFLKERYDFIMLFDVIEHIEKVQPFIEASLFHLKPGGLVFVNVPAINSLFSHYDKVVGHYRRYEKQMLQKELTACGLDIIDTNYWGATFLPILYLRRLLLRNVKEDVVVKKGFEPPGALVNAMLKAMINIEVSLFPKPYLGASLLAIARKR